MDFALTPGPNGQLRMSLDAASDIRNNILLSLHVKRGSFFLDKEFGSRLYEIQSLSLSDIALAQQYATECLAWLIKIGRAIRFTNPFRHSLPPFLTRNISFSNTPHQSLY